MGSLALGESPSPPRTCTTTPNIHRFAVRGGKETPKGSPSKDKEELNRDILIRYLWTQGTDIINDMRVINTDSASYQSKNPRSACKMLRQRRRRRSTLTRALTSVGTSLPLLPQWTAFLGSRQRRNLNVLPATSRKIRRNSTHVPAGTWRVRFRSLSSRQRTAVSRGQGSGL